MLVGQGSGSLWAFSILEYQLLGMQWRRGYCLQCSSCVLPIDICLATMGKQGDLALIKHDFCSYG